MTVTVDDQRYSGLEVRIPAAIDSPRAKLVYLSLHLLDGGTVDDLHVLTRISKLSLYSILRTLERSDVVSKSGSEYRIRDA